MSKEFVGYRQSLFKSITFAVGCVLSFGLLFIVTKWKPYWRLCLTHSQCALPDADIIFTESLEQITIPGVKPRDEKSGNLKDIQESGSIHQFLTGLHQKYGPIASFFFGKRLAVSIATPELFKTQMRVFDRPFEISAEAMPLLGKHSVEFANGETGKYRHAAYRRCFSDVYVNNSLSIFHKFSDEVVTTWSSLPEKEHINLQQHMFNYSFYVALRTAFGSFFDDVTKMQSFRTGFNACWNEMEKQIEGIVLEDDIQSQHEFAKNREKLVDIVMQAADFRLQNRKSENIDEKLFVDVALELNLTPDELRDDMVSVLLGGFHTTSCLLTWALYNLAKNQDIQDRLHREIMEKVGKEQINKDNIAKLTYLQQVIDEALRWSTIVPFAGRFQDKPTTLAEYSVPANAMIIQAIGVVHEDPLYYPNPDKFDPDRFNPEQSAARHSLAFQPFGFAGKRKCPGFKLSLAESKVLLVSLLQEFQIHLVPGQNVSKLYGFLTAPDVDVWITVSKRV